jgi:hypothetical protein
MGKGRRRAPRGAGTAGEYMACSCSLTVSGKTAFASIRRDGPRARRPKRESPTRQHRSGTSSGTEAGRSIQTLRFAPSSNSSSTKFFELGPLGCVVRDFRRTSIMIPRRRARGTIDGSRPPAPRYTRPYGIQPTPGSTSMAERPLTTLVQRMREVGSDSVGRPRRTGCASKTTTSPTSCPVGGRRFRSGLPGTNGRRRSHSAEAPPLFLNVRPRAHLVAPRDSAPEQVASFGHVSGCCRPSWARYTGCRLFPGRNSLRTNLPGLGVA